ncbi:hypothetical protein QFW80_00115 [Luteimonas sp. M1R5S18]|uniref:YEATS domain-containing protein n=1 Tax=Luteimonas rhizosphaericola TaxID=3042024 RepID=A0ABT6JET9_9GAMM|nr:pYEATS domain-containing protein [Luteimonas rhizosphaericola]MDH5828928.1 hypothetical protein [Luteimonas rhizosphaericola]
MDLLTALVWPALIVGVLYWQRNDIQRLLSALASRVERGDTFEAGGIKLESTQPRLPTDAPSPSAAADSQNGADPGPPHDIFLLHRFRRDRSLDKNGHVYYRLNIWIESDGIDLSTIESVTYHLHESFKDPVRTITDHSIAFELNTAGWGSFLLFADVKFHGGATWRIERYLNF